MTSQPATTRTADTRPAARTNAVGIDIGGTKIYGAFVNPDSGTNQPIGELQHVATPRTASGFLGAIVDIIETLKKDGGIGAVGIATAGVVNADTGQVLGSTGNLPALREIANLGELVASKVGLPVHVENDANAAAYGEFRAGAAKGTRNAIMVTLGTGVGMGIILNSQMYRGANYFAAEGGHIALSNRQERMCTCGKWGCWEAYASGTGLRVTVQEALLSAPDPIRADFLAEGKSFPDATTYDLMEAHKKGNPLAKALIARWHEDIALGLGSLINVLDPEVTVIGGGLAQFVDFGQLSVLTEARSMRPAPRIIPATLGNLAGLVGAAYLAIDSQESHGK